MGDKFKRFIVTLLASIVAATGLAIATASPAHAVACGGSVVGICFYDIDPWQNDPQPTEAFQIYYPSVPRNVCLSNLQDNVTSYIWNKTQYRWLVFRTNDCGGTNGIIYPHSSGYMNADFNNRIQAVFRTSMTSLHAGPMAGEGSAFVPIK